MKRTIKKQFWFSRDEAQDLQKKAKTVAPVKDASDRKLVEKVLEDIQGACPSAPPWL